MVEEILLPVWCWHAHRTQRLGQSVLQTLDPGRKRMHVTSTGRRFLPRDKRGFVFRSKGHEEMQMVRHQHVSADEDAAFARVLAESAEALMHQVVGQPVAAVLGTSGDEVKRVAGEEPVEPFESRSGTFGSHHTEVTKRKR